MLAGFLGVMAAPAIALAKGVDIELASGELSERQRQEISVEADLDPKAPVFRVLDFLEEVLLASASGESSEVSLLTTARQLLEATGDVIGILDALRSLVLDSDIGGTSQRKWDPEVDSGTELASEALQSLVSDSDTEGTGQQKWDPEVDSGAESTSEEVAFLAHRLRHRSHRLPSLI